MFDGEFLVSEHWLVRDQFTRPQKVLCKNFRGMRTGGYRINKPMFLNNYKVIEIRGRFKNFNFAVSINFVNSLRWNGSFFTSNCARLLL